MSICMKRGQEIICGQRKFRIGMPVRATSGTPFAGLYGTLECVKTGDDRECPGRDLELYAAFTIPRRPALYDHYLDRLGAGGLEELRDWQRMEPYHLVPGVLFRRFVRHRESRRQYLVYLNHRCCEIATDITFRWPYQELRELMEPLEIQKSDVNGFIKRLCAEPDYILHELAHQIEDAVYAESAGAILSA